MLSAIRKLFRPLPKADRDAERDHQKPTTRTPPPTRPPRTHSRQHKANKHEVPNAKKQPAASDNSRGSGRTSSRSGTDDSSNEAAAADEDTQSGDGSSVNTNSQGTGTQSSDNNPNKHPQHPVAEQGNHSLVVDTKVVTQLEPNCGDFYTREETEDESEDEAEDEEEDELNLEDSCRVPFIAESSRHLQQQAPQQRHNYHQSSLAQNYQSQGPLLPQHHATTATMPAVRKTDVDQLLTGSHVGNSQRRDGVRGNLEELRVAESVNYRPVVYRYSFRVHDIPANMRVFTDPDDRRIEAIARSCDSQVHLEKLAIRGPGSLKMRKVTIQAPDLHSLEKCCRQFDDRFPHFYVSGGLGLSSKSIQRVYVDELDRQ